MCRVGMAMTPAAISLRRAHSPAAISRTGEQRGEKDPHARPEQALLDRVAHQENAAERQRQAADPHHPLGAESFFQRGRWRRGGRRSGVGRRWPRAAPGRSRSARSRAVASMAAAGSRRGGWLRGRRGDRRGRPACFQRLDAHLQLARAVAGIERHHQSDDGNDRECQNQQHARPEFQTSRAPGLRGHGNGNRPQDDMKAGRQPGGAQIAGRAGTGRLPWRRGRDRWSRPRAPCGRGA